MERKNDRNVLTKEQLLNMSYYEKIILIEQGMYLDVFIHDERAVVRMAEASQGYGLDILVHDEDSDVRYCVACQGYGLDKLINDKDENVQVIVNLYLYLSGLTLEQWKEQYPEKCVLNKEKGEK